MSYAMKVIPAHKLAHYIDQNLIKFNIGKDKEGRRFVKMYVEENGTKNDIGISTPNMMTWGIADYEDNKRFNLNLQFPRDEDEHKSEKTDAFLSALKKLEQYIIDFAFANAIQLFPAKPVKTRDSVEDDKFHAILKYRKDPKTKQLNMESEPSISIKAVKNKDNVPVFDFQIFQEPITKTSKAIYSLAEPNDIEPNEIVEKMMTVKTLFHLSNLWVIQGKVSTSMQLVQVVIPQSAGSSDFNGCVIMDEDEAEEEVVEEADDAEDAEDTEEAEEAEDADEADEAEDEEDVVEEEVVVEEKVVEKPKRAPRKAK